MPHVKIEFKLMMNNDLAELLQLVKRLQSGSQEEETSSCVTSWMDES